MNKIVFQPTPTKEGFYWAKLVAPTRVPPNETADDWKSVDFEPVEVFDNNGEGDEALMVMVIGRELSQHLHAFEWGHEIPKPVFLA